MRWTRLVTLSCLASVIAIAAVAAEYSQEAPGAQAASPADFIAFVLPLARAERAIPNPLGQPPVSFIIAQAAKESGWNTAPPANIFFGIKCPGLPTHTECYQPGNFRMYSTPSDAFTDHQAWTHAQANYNSVWQYSNDPIQFARAVANCWIGCGETQAHKDAYANSIISIIQDYNLTQYDNGVCTDSDGDGICDDVDQCPDSPEDIDGYQDSDGCPEGGPPVEPPSVSVSVSPDWNGNHWNNEDVSISWAITPNGTSNSPDCSVTGVNWETYHEQYTCTATNSAGSDSATTREIKIDKTKPGIDGSTVPPLNSRGWSKGDVTAHFSCYDIGPVQSGIASCTGDQPISGEGWNLSGSGTAVDKADNSAGASLSVNIDKTPPELDINDGVLDGLHWDQTHLVRGIFTNTATLAATGDASDNLCLWEVRAVDTDSNTVLASQPGPGQSVIVIPPPTPMSMVYSLNVPLHTGINNISFVAEDCAGWQKSIATQVVYVVPGPFDPQMGSFWTNAVEYAAAYPWYSGYTKSQMQTFLDYINVVSDVFGPGARNIYGPVTLSNYQSLLNPVRMNGESQLAISERYQKAQLLDTWLNLVSGRVEVLQPASFFWVWHWNQILHNTGGSSLTFALNLPMQVEEVDQTRTASNVVYNIAFGMMVNFNMRLCLPWFSSTID
jgi:hypothetical protein